MDLFRHLDASSVSISPASFMNAMTPLGVRKTHILSITRRYCTSDKWNYNAAPFLSWVLLYGTPTSHYDLPKKSRRTNIVAKHLVLVLPYYLEHHLLLHRCRLLFAQCSPASASWNRSVPHTCWSPAVLADSNFSVGGMSRRIKPFATVS